MYLRVVQKFFFLLVIILHNVKFITLYEKEKQAKFQLPGDGFRGRSIFHISSVPSSISLALNAFAHFMLFETVFAIFAYAILEILYIHVRFTSNLCKRSNKK